MVRSSANRASKYAAKSVGDVVKNRFDAQKDSMASQFLTSAGEAERIETGVNTITNAAGVSVFAIPAYLSYARAAGKILRNHTGTTALNELCYLEQKWEARGLDAQTLVDIVQTVFNTDIGSCTTP